MSESTRPKQDVPQGATQCVTQGKRQYLYAVIGLPKDVLQRFDRYCRKQGMTRSERIAVLVQLDMELNEKAQRAADSSKCCSAAAGLVKRDLRQ